MKQTISNRQGKQLAVYTDCLKDAPVLVFSNSLGTDHGMWQPQLNELKSHFNVIT
ncbi:3-oxoadipate enol-lactonase, partial [Acinetobacter baumannii]